MTEERRQRVAPWLGLLALLVAAMFADVLLPGARMLGDARGDMPYHSLPWRAFGFGELAKGNLALWNPYVFGGGPYFGGMQSALLYPPNWLFLVLPLALAMNWSIALNVWLLGAFTFLWALRRGLRPFAAFVGAALFMFCAPHFLRMQAGLITQLASIAWAPLVFLSIDEWLASRRARWCLLGMLAIALQIFAGQPQYVYYTAIVAAVYSGLRLLELREGVVVAAAGLLSLYAGGALLAAVQMLAGLDATAETVRGQALPYDFASSFSFPPESLLTLLAPGFFGDIHHQAYWGRWFLWEACAFMGVLGLALAAYGAGVAGARGRWALLGAAATAMLLALGDNTPVYRVLYDWLPWFDKFRSVARFMYLASMIFALFAAYGLDRILRERAVSGRALWVAGGAAATMLGAALVVRAVDWFPVLGAMIGTRESYADGAIYSQATGVLAAQSFAAFSLAIAGVTLALGLGVAVAMRGRPQAALLVGVLAVAEAFAFARMQRPTFDSHAATMPELRQALAAQPGDYRILNLFFPNGGVLSGARDAWGYDPAVERRYAEFMFWSEGKDPGLATQMLEFRRFHPLLAMLRVKYVVEVQDSVLRLTPLPAAPLGRVELIGAYRVRTGRDAVLGAMGESSFDPRREVILEREPQPAPVSAPSQGHASVVRQGTDWLEIEADVASPSILLVTDAWSPAWRARPLEGSGASAYEVMPADYALRAVPLAAGRHRLRLEYAPSGFRIGLAVSALAWLAWAGAAAAVIRAERNRLA
jgi:hypothetical protein